MDLISVIIPMYNAEKYIAKLLNCLKNQTYRNLEIIVINDGSTDNSLNIVQEIAKDDNRIRVISIPNAGVGNARNIGIENAKGDYITFLDADDYIDIGTYEKIIEKIKETGTKLLRYNFIKEDESGNIIECNNNLENLANKSFNENDIKNIILPSIFEDKVPTYVTLLVIKSDLIKNKIKYRTDIHMMEDLLFCLELYLKAKQIYICDFKYYHYVYNRCSSTKSRANIIRNYYNTIDVVHSLEKFLKHNNIEETIFSKVYYIYSTILIKYILRTFQEDDEYKISYDKMVEMLVNSKAVNIIKKANFLNCKNNYIRTASEYIQKDEYNRLYNYAIEIRKIKV